MFDLTERRLYLCTPIRSDLASFVEGAIAGGVDIVQLREKLADARAVLAAAAICRDVCAHYGVPFILNDRADLALDVGADGVHVGQDDAPVELCRRILGPTAIIGVSTHGESDLVGALADQPSYVSAGPVTETPTKPGRPGTGLDYAAQATVRSPVPVFVTGGVTPSSVPALAAAGVEHFVVVRYITDSDDPERAARELRDAIDTALARRSDAP